MRIPKKYGQSKINKCPFCEREGTVRNPQGIPVCEKHRNEKLQRLKCVCGDEVEVSVGKYGPYVQCLNCGNIALKKVLEFNYFR